MDPPPATSAGDASVEREPLRGKVEPASMLGIEAGSTHAGLQTDCFKELINKLSWVLGSTYRQPYAGKNSPAREYALRMAQAVLRDHGYPRKISKNGIDSE